MTFPIKSVKLNPLIVMPLSPAGIIMKRRPIPRNIIFLIIPFFLLCCNPDTGRGKVKVGLLFPLSGELADKGIDSIRGIQLAVDDINKAGGIKSLSGAKLELITADTQGDPYKGAAETEKLICDSDVSVLIGTYQSSVTKQATQVAEKYQTPFIVSISMADIITERGFRYTFRIEPRAEFYCHDQVRFLQDLKKNTGYSVSRIALIHENSDFGTSVSFSQKKLLRENGFKVVADISYNASGIKTLSREISRVIESRPDAILGVTYLNDSILIVKALEQLNSTVPFIDTAGGTVSPDFTRRLGNSAEYILSSTEFSTFTDKGRELNNHFRSRFATDITGDSAYAYQSVLVLKNALERSGSADRESIRNALASTDMKNDKNVVIPSDRIKFGKDGQNIAARLFIVQIQDGEYIPVWPDEYAQGKVKIRR